MAAKKDPKEPVTVEVKHTLYVKLTPEEVIQRAKTASELAAEIATEEESIKADAAARKAELKKVKERFHAAVNAANDGKEYQTVDCVQVFDVAKKTTHYLYRDEAYGKRTMFDQEMREVTQRIFKDEPPQLPGVKTGANGDELAKQAAAPKPKKTKADPKYAVQNVTPINKAANGDIADVIKDETRKGGKKDHTT